MALTRCLAALVFACCAFSQDPGTDGRQALCDGIKSARLAGDARQALRSGRAGEASSLFREAHDACPAERRRMLEASQSLTAARNFPEAISWAQEFLRFEPNSTPGLLVLANALFMAQRLEECGPVVDRVLKVEPDNPAALLLKANNTYLLGDNAQAEQILLKLLDRNPKDVDAAYTLGRIYYMENRADYAMGQFQRVIRLDPKHYKAWDNLGLCYDALGNSDLAIRHFLTAIKLVDTDHSEYGWPYANLADLLLRQNRYEEAYQSAVQAANRSPGTARNFYLGGQALVKLQRASDAEAWLARAVALDPAYPDALYALGQLYIRTGEKDKGAETLKRFQEVKANAPKQRR